jgi:hypothetical protein
MPRRVLLCAAIAVAAILVVVLGAALLQDDEAPARPTATTQDTAALRAEVSAAATNFWDHLDKAAATNDLSQLDGIYVPGSDLERGQREVIQKQIDRGEVEVSKIELSDVQPRSVDQLNATVALKRTFVEGEIRDARSGRVKARRSQRFTRPVTMGLTKVDGSWRVSSLDLGAAS